MDGHSLDPVYLYATIIGPRRTATFMIPSLDLVCLYGLWHWASFNQVLSRVCCSTALYGRILWRVAGGRSDRVSRSLFEHGQCCQADAEIGSTFSLTDSRRVTRSGLQLVIHEKDMAVKANGESRETHYRCRQN